MTNWQIPIGPEHSFSDQQGKLSEVIVPASVLFFFFQAEDGIRDFHVTGVQTCALPISMAAVRDRFVWDLAQGKSPARIDDRATGELVVPPTRFGNPQQHYSEPAELKRSEERRVGKECTSGRAREKSKDNDDADRGEARA